jgi:hypothetical protein
VLYPPTFMVAKKLKTGRLVLFLITASTLATGQQTPCKVDLPVNVLLPTWALVRGLNPNAFVSSSKEGALRIDSVIADSGPRRILFVVETGKHLREITREVQVRVISDFLSTARPGDTFALLTARGPRKEIQFGSDRTAFQAAVDELKSPPKGKNQPGGVLDAVLEALGWFKTPQLGDAIVVLTMGIESPHHAGFTKVREALSDAGVRLFGFQLGQVLGGTVMGGVGFGPGGDYALTNTYSPNVENVFALYAKSGGVAFEENTEGSPWHQYKLDDESLKRVKDVSGQISKAIAELYSLQMEAPPKDFVIELADPIRKQIPKAWVMYPAYPPRCGVGSASRLNE